MVFSSITFLYYFLPFLLICYYIVPKKYRNITLLIFSLMFYFYGEQNIILVLSCILNYFIGTMLNNKHKKWYLTIGIIFNVLLLAYYKYSNFFIENVNNLFNLDIKYLNLILPLGISFFTFQNISYLVDVYKGEVLAQKNIFQYATYITLFPQLIAGPIVRYKDINEELENRKENFSDFSAGIVRFIIGLSKKVLIANTIGSMCTTLNGLAEKTVLSHILEAIGYTFQLYFDFSGYSDMAIGLGLLFGFHFKENFNYPLIASSITDFWRRWHISLSSFFRDYIYIPLGGNRTTSLKWIRNICVVWLLTGLWHGASWNFVLWGLYFLVFLVIEKLFLKKFLKNGIFSHLYTLVIVLFSFVIFNMPDLASIGDFFRSILGFNNLSFANMQSLYYLKNYLVILIVASICSTPLLKILSEKLQNQKFFKTLINVASPICYIGLALLCSANLLSNSFNPFIYFRF